MLEAESAVTFVHRVDGLPDERRCKRLPVHQVKVRNPVVGTVVDLTEDGLGIVCDRPLRLFEHYNFTIAGLRTPRFRRRGEVRWSRLTTAGVSDSGRPELVYRVGIAFVD